MQEKVSFWVSITMLICVSLGAVIVALHSTGMPISGWGLICSTEDEDVVSCFRDWITSGAAVLTGVAIVFAVAQVREANRQGDAAVRASMVHFKGQLIEERMALNVVVDVLRQLLIAERPLTFALRKSQEDRDEIADRALSLAEQLDGLEPFRISGLHMGDLPNLRETHWASAGRLHLAIADVCRLLRNGYLLDSEYQERCMEIARAHSVFAETIHPYHMELDRRIDQAAQKIARLDAEVFAERH